MCMYYYYYKFTFIYYANIHSSVLNKIKSLSRFSVGFVVFGDGQCERIHV